MAVNHFFNPFPNDRITQEQLTLEDLLVESLKIYSTDCYYLPRESKDQIDKLWGEDTVKTFPNAHPLEFYIENVLSMEGEMDLMSKFGLDIRDEMTLLVSRRRFKKEVQSISRPREGDVLYIPFVDGFYEIYSVEHENNQAMFYTLGRGRGGNVYVYAIKVRQMVFSDESIRTGVEVVDDSISDSYRPLRLILSPGGVRDFDFVNKEFITTATASANVYSWDTSNKWLDVTSVSGLFTTGQIVVGSSSNAQWTIATVDSDGPLDTLFEDMADNKTVQDEANTIIDWSEANPFGLP